MGIGIGKANITCIGIGIGIGILIKVLYRYRQYIFCVSSKALITELSGAHWRALESRILLLTIVFYIELWLVFLKGCPNQLCAPLPSSRVLFWEGLILWRHQRKNIKMFPSDGKGKNRLQRYYSYCNLKRVQKPFYSTEI